MREADGSLRWNGVEKIKHYRPKAYSLIVNAIILGDKLQDIGFNNALADCMVARHSRR